MRAQYRAAAWWLRNTALNNSLTWLVILLLAFPSTVIPGFSLLEIHGQDFCSLLPACLPTLLIKFWHGPHRKHRSFVAVRLLHSGGMTYSIVMCTAIGMDRAENTIPLLFAGHCLVMAGCCDSTILALSEYTKLCTYLTLLTIMHFWCFHTSIFSCVICHFYAE
jgi:hypothetical protein